MLRERDRLNHRYTTSMFDVLLFYAEFVIRECFFQCFNFLLLELNIAVISQSVEVLLYNFVQL